MGGAMARQRESSTGLSGPPQALELPADRRILSCACGAPLEVPDGVLGAVPSVGGISHAPEEDTPPQDVANGADVLLHTLLALDERS
jgi:acetylornithine deacetylase/succinyl-diaminopimelate desuccinylase-like protein